MRKKVITNIVRTLVNAETIKTYYSSAQENQIPVNLVKINPNAVSFLEDHPDIFCRLEDKSIETLLSHIRITESFLGGIRRELEGREESNTRKNLVFSIINGLIKNPLFQLDWVEDILGWEIPYREEALMALCPVLEGDLVKSLLRIYLPLKSDPEHFNREELIFNLLVALYNSPHFEEDFLTDVQVKREDIFHIKPKPDLSEREVIELIIYLDKKFSETKGDFLKKEVMSYLRLPQLSWEGLLRNFLLKKKGGVRFLENHIGGIFLNPNFPCELAYEVISNGNLTISELSFVYPVEKKKITYLSSNPSLSTGLLERLLEQHSSTPPPTHPNLNPQLVKKILDANFNEENYNTLFFIKPYFDHPCFSSLATNPEEYKLVLPSYFLCLSQYAPKELIGEAIQELSTVSNKLPPLQLDELKDTISLCITKRKDVDPRWIESIMAWKISQEQKHRVASLPCYSLDKKKKFLFDILKKPSIYPWEATTLFTLMDQVHLNQDEQEQIQKTLCVKAKETLENIDKNSDLVAFLLNKEYFSELLLKEKDIEDIGL